MEETRAGAREQLNFSQRWPREGWWREFRSPELNRLMDLALKDNPGLKVASARLRLAQALVRVEGARLLPFLDAEAELTVERISSHGVFAALNPEVAGIRIMSGMISPLSFRYEFDFWGKNRAALEAALGEAAAEEAERAETRLLLTTAVARAYFRMVALRQQLDLTRDMVQLRRTLSELAETRFKLGLDSADAVKQALVEQESANKREAGVRDQLELQKNLLARLIGSGPDVTSHLTTHPVPIPARVPWPTHLPLELLAHRPDLTAALYHTEAAAQRIKEAKAVFFPSVDLTAFVGTNALVLTKGANHLANLLFSGSSITYGVAPGVRIPWFEGGRLRGELSAQRAEYDRAVELYNDTLLHAVQEVADSLSAWRETSAIREAHQHLLAAQREKLAFVQVRLHSGLDDRRPVLEQQHAVLEQEYAARVLEADQLVAAVDLVEALGGGYHNQIRMEPLEQEAQ